MEQSACLQRVAPPPVARKIEKAEMPVSYVSISLIAACDQDKLWETSSSQRMYLKYFVYLAEVYLPFSVKSVDVDFFAIHQKQPKAHYLKDNIHIY